MDRISRLPDEILHEILSRIIIDRRQQQASGSDLRFVKEMTRVWATLPNLQIYDSQYNPGVFVKFVNKFLSNRNHHTHISTIQICFMDDVFGPDLMNNLANYAISHNIQELTMSCRTLNKEFPLGGILSSPILKKFTLDAAY